MGRFKIKKIKKNFHKILYLFLFMEKTYNIANQAHFKDFFTIILKEIIFLGH